MDWDLFHDENGKWVFQDAEGNQSVGVIPVRAFPITNPNSCISILSSEGLELLWLEHLEDVSAEKKENLFQAIAKTHFLPVIQKIVSIEGMTEPTSWQVITDRGQSAFKVKSEEDVRRFGGFRAMISDANQVRYLIPDMRQLDSASRKWLSRYL